MNAETNRRPFSDAAAWHDLKSRWFAAGADERAQTEASESPEPPEAEETEAPPAL